jgi:hypothetical protein
MNLLPVAGNNPVVNFPSRNTHNMDTLDRVGLGVRQGEFGWQPIDFAIDQSYPGNFNISVPPGEFDFLNLHITGMTGANAWMRVRYNNLTTSTYGSSASTQRAATGAFFTTLHEDDVNTGGVIGRFSNAGLSSLSAIISNVSDTDQIGSISYGSGGFTSDQDIVRASNYFNVSSPPIDLSLLHITAATSAFSNFSWFLEGFRMP